MTEYVIPHGADADPMIYLAVNGTEHVLTAGVPFTPTAQELIVLQESRFGDDLQLVEEPEE